jgi:thiamine kinase-like enzyme
MYRDESNGWLYIVMELLKGELLDRKWPALLDGEKSQVVNELQRIFEQMRLLPSPGFYGDVCQRALPHHLFWTREQTRSGNGPFETEHEFNMGFVGKLRMIAHLNGLSPYKADFYERNLSLALKNNPPTFSHSDVQRKIILVRERDAPASRLLSQGQGKDYYYEVAVIDWENAGWYPSYWEYASVAIAFQWDDDWPAKFEEFISPRPAESALIKCLYQEIFV